MSPVRVRLDVCGTARVVAHLLGHARGSTTEQNPNLQRPPLSASGESPLLRVRLSHELDDAVRRPATRSGASRSEWVRRVLDDAANQAS